MHLYVGNISYHVGEEDLKKVFEDIGHVDSVEIVTDKYSGRSKGFGFVKMKNPSDADCAVSKLNGKIIGGKSLKVNKTDFNNNSGFKRTYSK